ADHNLSLMYWYAAEPAVAADVSRGIALMKQSKIPLVRQFIARRIATVATNDAKGDAAKVRAEPLAVLSSELATITDAQIAQDVLTGMSDALRGWPSLPAPAGWDKVYANLETRTEPEIANHLRELSVIFGEERAMASLRK